MGEVAERSKAAVLKTVELKGSQGSNPCLSAILILFVFLSLFALQGCDFFPDPQRRVVSIRLESANLGDAAFSPNPVRVPIGGRVVWRNDDKQPHSIVGDAKKGLCAFRSDEMGSGKSFSKLFFKPVTCNYYCGIHFKAMRGKIIVE